MATARVVTPAEAYTSGQAAMPWGSPRDEERNCPESVGHGGYNFGKGLVQGVGMLTVGYNPETGGFWEGKAYGQAWGGLGDLLGSTVLLASPVGWVAAGRAATGHTDSAFDDFMYDRSETVIGGWGGLVGYDLQAAENGGNGWHKWEEDGWATGTESVLNVGTFFIPGAGVAGGSAKVGATGARLSRVARLTHGAADFAVPGGSWAVRGGMRMTERLRFFDGFDTGIPTSLAKGAKGAESPYASVLAAMDDVPTEAAPRNTPVSESIAGRGAESPAPHHDPGVSPRETVGPSQAPERYGPDDVQAARDRAPVNDQGQPVDHRTGEPLRADGPGGERRWHMAYDPATGEWVAQNPGAGHAQAGDLPASGEPDSFGYDAQGERMPYANHRPDYAEQQVETVWENAKDENGEVWVTDRDGERVRVEWEPGEPRKGVWDMGHEPDVPYRDLREAYLNHEITLDEFLDEYRDPDNYDVEHPGRNQSHVDEVSAAVSDQAMSESSGRQGAETLSGQVLDSFGRDITSVIDASGLDRSQLIDYLEANNPQAAVELQETGQWPATEQIPHDPNVLQPNGRIDWSDVPSEGFAYVEGEQIREPYVPVEGEIIDRFGPPGRFVSPVPESGPYPYGERALPYVEDAGQYHRYEVVGDMSDLPSVIRNHPDVDLREEILAKLERYDVDVDSLVVERGPIAPGFGRPGGGVQYKFPLSTMDLEDLGVLRELDEGSAG